jgi:hypothetical protein
MTPLDASTAEYLVFFLDGSTTHCDAANLHANTARDDYAFALDLSQSEGAVAHVCEQFGISETLYGALVEYALFNGAIAAGSAAVMTLVTAPPVGRTIN